MRIKTLMVLHYPPPIHGAAIVGEYVRTSNIINKAFNCRYLNLGTSTTVDDIGRNRLSKVLRYFLLIWHLKKQLITFRPKICYLTPNSHGAGFYKDALVILLVKLFRVKTLYHYHNKGINTRQEYFFDNILYRFTFKNSYVILLSQYLYPDIQKYVQEERVYYCANGIPEIRDKRDMIKVEERYNDIALGGSKGDSKVVDILFLSHLIKSKGVLILIDACEILKSNGIGFHCTIAGGDAELTKQGVEAIVSEKGMSSFISVIGPKNGEEKADLMIITDIFVHPTFNDCFPLVLIEAMQYSIPVVSTFEGGIPDIVVDGITGFLVPPRDAAALAVKLELLIQNPEIRRAMGIAGRARYEHEFTLDQFENRLKVILEEVGGLSN